MNYIGKLIEEIKGNKYSLRALSGPHSGQKNPVGVICTQTRAENERSLAYFQFLMNNLEGTEHTELKTRIEKYKKYNTINKKNWKSLIIQEEDLQGLDVYFNEFSSIHEEIEKIIPDSINKFIKKCETELKEINNHQTLSERLDNILFAMDTLEKKEVRQEKMKLAAAELAAKRAAAELAR